MPGGGMPGGGMPGGGMPGGGMPGGMGDMGGDFDQKHQEYGNPDDGEEDEEEVSLSEMLQNLDILDHMQDHVDKIPISMRRMVIRVKHQVLDRVSCVTECLHKNKDGKCHEQSCLFHYQPSDTSLGKPTLCADSVVIFAESVEATGFVHFAIKSWKIPPMDGMVPAQFYRTIDDKFKYRTRLKDGTKIESKARVCKQFKNETCPDHPPPSPINAGDTLWVTVVSIDENNQYKNILSESYRVVITGSATGNSCEKSVGGGMTLGPRGLRLRSRSAKKQKELETRALEARLRNKVNHRKHGEVSGWRL
jgi:hypothetical protein